MIPSCCWCSVDFVFILKRSQFFPRDLSFDGLLLHKCVMHWNIAFCGRQIFYPRSKLHFQEYFPLQYHTCPFNTRWREYRFLLLLLHCHPSNLCFKRSCSFLQKSYCIAPTPIAREFSVKFSSGFTSFKLSAIFVAVVYHEQGLFCNIRCRH